MEKKTIHFSTVNKYGEYINMPEHITNSSDARHWIINHLDLSEEWIICRGEIRPKK
jgi:hypothetical protein